MVPGRDAVGETRYREASPGVVDMLFTLPKGPCLPAAGCCLEEEECALRLSAVRRLPIMSNNGVYFYHAFLFGPQLLATATPRDDGVANR